MTVSRRTRCLLSSGNPHQFHFLGKQHQQKFWSLPFCYYWQKNIVWLTSFHAYTFPFHVSLFCDSCSKCYGTSGILKWIRNGGIFYYVCCLASVYPSKLRQILAVPIRESLVSRSQIKKYLSTFNIARVTTTCIHLCACMCVAHVIFNHKKCVFS